MAEKPKDKPKRSYQRTNAASVRVSVNLTPETHRQLIARARKTRRSLASEGGLLLTEAMQK